jgi:phage terminase large subunit-like protein
MGRGNGKTGLAAMLALCHLAGPEAEPRGEVYAAANDKFQAGRLFNEIAAIVERVPWLAARISIRRHVKELEDIGGTGSMFAALSADVPTKHGLSPSFIVYDELGQSQSRDLLDALETGLGKRVNPMLWIISTQAATDAMPMSQVIDYGLRIRRGELADPTFHLILYEAPPDADPWKLATWRKANPGLGDILSLEHVRRLAKQAKNVPSAEASFRNLVLNQRVATSNLFIPPSIWKACGGPVDVKALACGVECYAGLDLSAVSDLTALVVIGKIERKWHVVPTFWLPAEGLVEKARADRVPYDLWARQGFLKTVPGRSISYEYVAEYLRSVFDQYNVRKLAFDAWGFVHLKPWLLKAGFTEQFIAEHFVEFRQGWKSMSPALRDLEQSLLEGEIAHGNHPVLTMCQTHAVVTTDAAGNRKLDKDRSTGRIDGMVALAMAHGVTPLRAAPIDVEALIG